MKQQEYRVAITGGAPYAENTPFNTSALIRDAVPSVISRPSHPTIHILKYPHDVESTYKDVFATIPQLWSGKLAVYDPSCEVGQKVHIDALLHMGMQRRANTFFVETRGRRDVYKKPGTDGLMLDDADAKRMWEGCPAELSVAYDVNDAVKRVKQANPDMTIVSSNDAGSFFCELQLYSSLAELYRQKESARVGFLHVPAGKEVEEIEKGARVATALIAAIVDDLESKGLIGHKPVAHH